MAYNYFRIFEHAKNAFKLNAIKLRNHVMANIYLRFFNTNIFWYCMNTFNVFFIAFQILFNFFYFYNQFSCIFFIYIYIFMEAFIY